MLFRVAQKISTTPIAPSAVPAGGVFIFFYYGSYYRRARRLRLYVPNRGYAPLHLI